MTINKFMKTDNDMGLLLIRLTMGLLFVYGGVGKLFGILGGPGLEMFSGMVWGMMWLAIVVGVVELVAGLALILGMWTREAGFALGIIILFAIGMVHWGNIMQVLVHLALVGALFALTYTGSGKKALMKD